jgi:hypothetical protein
MSRPLEARGQRVQCDHAGRRDAELAVGAEHPALDRRRGGESPKVAGDNGRKNRERGRILRTACAPRQAGCRAGRTNRRYTAIGEWHRERGAGRQQCRAPALLSADAPRGGAHSLGGRDHARAEARAAPPRKSYLGAARLLHARMAPLRHPSRRLVSRGTRRANETRRRHAPDQLCQGRSLRPSGGRSRVHLAIALLKWHAVVRYCEVLSEAVKPGARCRSPSPKPRAERIANPAECY